jgi:hypothetical protein
MENLFMDAVGPLMLFALALGICFVILRALVLWYFRIGEIVTLLESINKRLGYTGGDKIPPSPPTHLN